MKEPAVSQTKEAGVSDATVKVTPVVVPINSNSSDTVSVPVPVPAQASPSRNRDAPNGSSSKSYNPIESVPVTTNNMPGALVSQGSKESGDRDNHQHRDSPNSGPVHSPGNMNQSPQMSLRKPVTPQTTGSPHMQQQQMPMMYGNNSPVLQGQRGPMQQQQGPQGQMMMQMPGGHQMYPGQQMMYVQNGQPGQPPMYAPQRR